VAKEVVARVALAPGEGEAGSEYRGAIDEDDGDVERAQDGFLVMKKPAASAG